MLYYSHSFKAIYKGCAMNTNKELGNRQIIKSMIELGNLGKNTHIKGKTKEERFKKFKEIYYGSTSKSNSINK